MCPACLTSLLLWSTGAGAAGGLLWRVVRRQHTPLLAAAGAAREDGR